MIRSRSHHNHHHPAHVVLRQFPGPAVAAFSFISPLSLFGTIHHDDACHPLSLLTPTPSNNLAQCSPTGTALRMTSSSSSPPPPTGDGTDVNKRTATGNSNHVEGGGVNISIEYCNACRWMLRSTWLASELLTTFANDSNLACVTMKPMGPPMSEEGGIFRILSSRRERDGIEDGGGSSTMHEVVLWDRKVEGRFPESKEVKQLVRDCVDPDKDLGHSDSVDHNDASDASLGSSNDSSSANNSDCVECKEQQQLEDEQRTMSLRTSSSENQDGKQTTNTLSPIPSFSDESNHVVTIEYSTGSSIDCPSDNGLYHATYYANELLSMMYERNNWFKKKRKKQQQEGNASSDCRADGGDDDTDMPVAVTAVSLIPNRFEVGILRVRLDNNSEILNEQSELKTNIRNIVK
eukprot:CAMPEP_0181110574 /NCGR_PEP_ID=MMETSP1071-20121207/18792_1 /TAXON_ID=35127 /ORGANISM="Thalassiosira sp., Strain NH16" /LENGTH=405 /DNA_ID=CAMNT_0023194365 /DNA_START=66 /DNA_END=1283 /DNA_ORIENTATION=+